MWTSITYGFLYILTNMVWQTPITTLTNSPISSASDWATNSSAIIQRCLATKNDTNTLSLADQTVIKITWESNTVDYSWNTVTNMGATNAVTNYYSKYYLYGKQNYSTVSRYDEENGFEMAATNTQWFKLDNYGVSPLLWGGGMYASSVLTSTVPTVLGPFQVASQAGRYIYDTETNYWAYYGNIITTNGTGTNQTIVTNWGVIYPTQLWDQVTISNEFFVEIPFQVNDTSSYYFCDQPTTSELDKVFINYNPTDQRPNAITPLMGRDHLLLMDAKILELIPKYYNDKVAVGGSFDNYCATSGVTWVSNYYVGACWFDMADVLSIATSRYNTVLVVPSGTIVSTNIISATSNDYDYVTNTLPEVAGDPGDYDRTTDADDWTSRSGSDTNYYTTTEESEGGSTWGPGTPTTREVTVPPGTGTITRTTIVTNIIYVGGAEGSATNHNATKVSTTSRPGSTYATNVTSWTGIRGVGIAGEIDYYFYEEYATSNDYTRRATVGTNTVTSTYSREHHTDASTSNHYNKTTLTTNWIKHDRVIVWAKVPFTTDVTALTLISSNNWTSGVNQYYDKYEYNPTWSTNYSSTWWRVGSDVTTTSLTTNFWWLWTTQIYTIAGPYDGVLNTSNHTDTGTSDFNNRSYQTNFTYGATRVYIWAGVSNLLSDYMTPWVVDSQETNVIGDTTYYDSKLYNHGWSPTYNTGWRLYSETSPTLTGYDTKYFWDYTTTNYYKYEYDYYKAVTNPPAPSYYYPRSYTYYWLYPVNVVTTHYCNELYTPYGWQPTTVYYTLYHYHGGTYYDGKNYFKTIDNFVYTKDQSVYGIDEPRYTIRYKSSYESPPLYTVSSFWDANSNLLGGTNWMINPTYLTETQTCLSSNVLSVTNDGVVSTWTNYVTTNTIITNAAAYSNDWAISMWGDSFIQRYKATTTLQWTTCGTYIESATRTIGWVTNDATWAAATITTNIGGVYNSSIQGYGFAYTGIPFYYIYSKTMIRAKRLAGYILDGDIDCYMQFGTILSGRYDLESLGYDLGPYVKVSELTIPSGDTESGWLGDITTVPTYGSLTTYDWAHPWGYKIQNKAGAAVFVFKPEF